MKKDENLFHDDNNPGNNGCDYDMKNNPKGFDFIKS